MPLGNIWAFPSKTMSYDITLNAMKSLAERISKITAGYKGAGHPIDINVALEPEYLKAAEERFTRAQTRRAHPEVVHAGDGQPLRRRHPRRVRQGARPELLPHLRPRVHELRLGALPGAGVQGRIPEPLRLARPEAAHAALSPDRRRRSSHRRRYNPPDQRRSAGDPARVDPLQRPHPSQDQAERQRSRVGREPRAIDRQDNGRNAAEARRVQMGLLARLQREVPQREVPAGLPAPRQGDRPLPPSIASSTSNSPPSAT